MTKLKRIPIKYVRDRAKSRYVKDDKCYVCGPVEELLDFHHFHTVDVLFDKWIKEKGIKLTTADDVIAVRDDFINEHSHEMFEDAVTICRSCHKKLHSIYGQRPPLTTAAKQRRWLEKQRVKKQQL